MGFYSYIKGTLTVLFFAVLWVGNLSFASDSLYTPLVEYGKSFVGQKYRTKSPEGRPMDCSGYLNHIYGKFGASLANSSGAIGNQVDRIDLSEVRVGDLLFFKGSNARKKRVGHVSMVIAVDGKKITMMHSCHRGILIEENTLPYYQKRFLFAGRLPESQRKKLEVKLSQVAPEQDTTLRFQESTIDTSSAQLYQKDTVHIMGVGDIMLGTTYPSLSFLPPHDGANLLAPVASVLMSADLTIGNLEGSLFNGEGKVKSCSNPANCYAFKSPEHYGAYLKDAGFDVMGIANNHVGDFGVQAKVRTAVILDSLGIQYAGQLTKPLALFEKDGIKYGFMAVSPNTGTVDINEYPEMIKIVKHLDSLADIVIVAFHGGAEGGKYRHITRENEIFLEENRGNPYRLARALIDAGADIVFGHGPHVTRAIDLYKDRFIAYSLGNFATYGRFNLKGSAGYAPIINVAVDRQGKFLNAQITSTRQLGEGGPIIDTENHVLKEIQELTQDDIPESILRIGDDGLVTRKP